MQVVRRALGVLRVVSAAEGGATLKDLAKQLDVPLSSMHRLTSVLEANGWLARSPTNHRYFLGPSAAHLAGEERAEPPLTYPHSVVRELRGRTGETVFITEILADQVVCTALTEASRPTALFARFGQPMPLHAASSARVLLAYQSEAVAGRMLSGQPLVRFTRTTPRSVDDVMERLRLIRLRGYDTSDGHINDDVFVAAAPVRRSTGHVRAGLALAVPIDRLSSPDDRRDMIDAVVLAAADMSSDLGYGGG
jgi:IclR family acetate operon transcriptional repressor